MHELENYTQKIKQLNDTDLLLEYTALKMIIQKFPTCGFTSTIREFRKIVVKELSERTYLFLANDYC